MIRCSLKTGAWQMKTGGLYCPIIIYFWRHCWLVVEKLFYVQYGSENRTFKTKNIWKQEKNVQYLNAIQKPDIFLMVLYLKTGSFTKHTIFELLITLRIWFSDLTVLHFAIQLFKWYRNWKRFSFCLIQSWSNYLKLSRVFQWQNACHMFSIQVWIQEWCSDGNNANI